ncbi:ABC transporter G family member 36-like [Asparagus officinalis]|uniref:ABC transporter G family member 36-like n=1 Tax=Asparagus officinalis TaxID=4686 RepID=UPI00098E6D7C|nr:ABC transporter G family member 36-like [Asparagus officinalis]
MEMCDIYRANNSSLWNKKDEIFSRSSKDADDEVALKWASLERVGIDIPMIEVRYENLNVEAEIHVGNRGLPTSLNSVINVLEAFGNYLHILPSRKKPLLVLSNISGIVKPQRMTLLLGPPGSGNTTLLLTLAGKLGSNLKVSGKVTYNGDMDSFLAQIFKNSACSVLPTESQPLKV